MIQNEKVLEMIYNLLNSIQNDEVSDTTGGE